MLPNKCCETKKGWITSPFDLIDFPKYTLHEGNRFCAGRIIR